MTHAVITSPGLWSYAVFAAVAAVALLVLAVRGDWHRERGLDKLLLLGPLFYAAPLAAFATQHFTQTASIAALVPAWLPWHHLWAWFVGGCFIAGALSLITGVRTRLAARLLALVFFLFVLLMDAPGWLHQPHNRFALALAFRELAFSGGALALAAALAPDRSRRSARLQAAIAKYFLAIPILFYGFEQLLHGNFVSGVPLKLLTPAGLFGHAVWTYLAAVIYLIVACMLVANQRARTAVTCLGLTVLFLVLVVYVPMLAAQPASLNRFNFMADTLMFAGAVFLLAGSLATAQPRTAAATP